MPKGLLIFFIVLTVIAIIHFISLRMVRLAEEKKWKYRKVFWYFYGLLFAISGFVNMFPFEEFKPFALIQFLCGIMVFVLNYLGKIETKKTHLKK
jgi:cell division protein FtsW (lipid II flippase)